jgi:hypothetical protein
MSETPEEKDVVYAMPTLAMLPANNFKIHIDGNKHIIELPCSGSYKEIDPEFFSDDDGTFILFENDTLFVSSITKVLFAVSKYPRLADNQLFCPITITKKEDKLVICGQVVTMLGE